MVANYVPAPTFLSPGDTAWQLTAATLVGLMSIPGLAVLYGGLVKKKWAVNSALMVFYAFSMVLIVWVLWGYKMGFGQPLQLGPGILSRIVGIPGPALSSKMLEGRASVPLLNGGMPGLHMPMSSLVYFQFVFAAITPVLLAGSVLGRMNFKAWMLFVPIWATLVYSVNAFMLWGGGWLASLGVVDFSGGYVIHVAAGISGFVAAAVVGPRLTKDRNSFNPNNLLAVVTGAGLLWLGWNGFNGGDPYFANMDASAAVLNTNVAAATALVAWLAMDMMAYNKASLLGAVNGMVAGLVAITPAAGYVNGTGALLIGLAAGVIPWLTMNKLGKVGIFKKVDDTLGVIHTHYFAGAVGGLMTGLLADPHIMEYIGKTGFSVTGLFYGNPKQFFLQLLGLIVITVYDGVMTFIILKLISLVVPLRSSEADLSHGDIRIHGEMVYEEPIPIGLMGGEEVKEQDI
ncbi:MAG: ammonium transporter [Firmicutes bacterium]|uniref:Ammonium transporter n=1 Tax=Sulfobacillus benefaciens TaxID=453960 RepID=A0A2T2WWK3_9FIRM|nr:ammonium transporter [Bacillota bacterium]MCL5012759.1 ammonium transporter [Bacillota bacterium]PSR26627.1 MAG: ammonium transporter [Sulfobacillus benefaciens]